MDTLSPSFSASSSFDNPRLCVQKDSDPREGRGVVWEEGKGKGEGEGEREWQQWRGRVSGSGGEGVGE